MASAEDRAAFSYFTRISTRWMDCDVYGHVNNVVYYSFFDTAVAQYLVETRLLDPQKSDGHRPGRRDTVPILPANLVSGLVYAGMRVAHLGNSSVRYEIGLFTQR